MKFQISFNKFMRVVMTPILAGPRHCHVELTADRLKVKMGMAGWAFSAALPRSSVTDAKRATGPVLGWGAHGWRGQWLINGSSQGLVRVSIAPAGRGRCLIIPVKVRRLTLSLEEPDQFIAALAQRSA
ncbi:MAG: hypothetical protein ACXVH5_04475 [Ilumatobacteraceae bacterium]